MDDLGIGDPVLVVIALTLAAGYGEARGQGLVWDWIRYTCPLFALGHVVIAAIDMTEGRPVGAAVLVAAAAWHAYQWQKNRPPRPPRRRRRRALAFAQN